LCRTSPLSTTKHHQAAVQSSTSCCEERRHPSTRNGSAHMAQDSSCLDTATTSNVVSLVRGRRPGIRSANAPPRSVDWTLQPTAATLDKAWRDPSSTAAQQNATNRGSASQQGLHAAPHRAPQCHSHQPKSNVPWRYRRIRLTWLKCGTQGSCMYKQACRTENEISGRVRVRY
jgi:hypothetical protein